MHRVSSIHCANGYSNTSPSSYHMYFALRGTETGLPLNIVDSLVIAAQAKPWKYSDHQMIQVVRLGLMCFEGQCTCLLKLTNGSCDVL